MANGVKFGTPKYGEAVTQKQRVTVDDEAKTIEYIRRLDRKGVALAEIARRLNAQGKPTKRGKEWTATGVRNVLLRIKKYFKTAA
jgi:hypothetical protein